MKFDFPPKKYSGISSLISHVSKECQELILWMITYNPDDRPSASQIIKHPYFKDLKEIDEEKRKPQISLVNPKMVLSDNLTTNSGRGSISDGGDSVNSKTYKKSTKGRLVSLSHNPAAASDQ